MGDAAAAMQELQDVTDRLSHFRSKSSLMKKLSSLLHPKKSKSKSGSPSQKPAPPPLPSVNRAGSELELLFAHAEATLGELIVRAGASFEARSSSCSHADQHYLGRGSDRSGTGELEDVSALITSSGSRSAKFSGPGHARRRSLSRVWQQLGGSLFCGSGHMSTYVMDRDTMAPAQSKDLYEDAVLDETYWQSLADAMLLHQQQKGDKLAGDDTHGQVHDLSCGATKQQHPVHLHVTEEEEDRESEIVPSTDADNLSKFWPTVGGNTGRRSFQDMDSIPYRDLICVESGGGGCTRLNTTLDESPNLAHNYLNVKVGGTSSGLNCYSDCPDAQNSRPDRDEARAERPSMVSGSSSMQPLERFLWQARSVAEPSSLVGGRAFSPSSRSAPESLGCQESAGLESSGTTSCRVSLMTLLHEEAAAADSTATSDARPEEEEVDTAAPRSMGSTMQVAGEDPLLCCVCMIRRKAAALIPCGHTFCRTCAKQLFAGRGACPLCNNLIAQVLDIF